MESLLLLLAGAVLAIWLYTWLDRRRRRRRAVVAQTGEKSAREWLEAHGFRVREEQARLRARMMVDGAISEFDVCADYIVERNGRRIIVEVKTGNQAHPTSRATRRQIFEYATLFDADVCVFDANRQHLHTVRFESLGRRRPFVNPWLYWWTGIGIGIAIGLIARIE